MRRLPIFLLIGAAVIFIFINIEITETAQAADKINGKDLLGGIYMVLCIVLAPCKVF